ncbi:MAG: rubrerythrin family protein [Acidobacteriota bacterium]|nr:rubrerythrin family protein [Acidobacteriota bacterium]
MKGNEMIPIKSLFAGTSVAALALLAILVSPRVAMAAPTTLDNMQAAFNGESNAHARYLAFANKADAEGYGQVASMFRAAARAEEIHASNHAAVIKTMGAVPQAKIDAPDVKSTRENLQAAIKGETYERDVMYPDFLRKAKLDRNRDAVKSLNFAKTAEAEHAKLYTEALNSLDQLKGSKSEAFYVCPTCGFTARTLPQEKCPSCFTPKGKFEKVA